VRLYSFPTDSEYTDNVAAYWTPDAAPVPGRRIDLSYRLDWSAAQNPAGTDLARVANVWRGRGDQPDAQRLVVDFADVPDGVRPDVWTDVTGGRLIKAAGYPVLGQPGLYRAVIDLATNAGVQSEVRLQLRSAGRVLSEYVHYPITG